MNVCNDTYTLAQKVNQLAPLAHLFHVIQSIEGVMIS
eukprot:COSAG01_NODE_20732_length_938_cov_0.974970_2_plen_36_part_01